MARHGEVRVMAVPRGSMAQIIGASSNGGSKQLDVFLLTAFSDLGLTSIM